MLRRLLRVALYACPASYRRMHGADMEKVFVECVARERQRRPRIWWLSATGGLVEAVGLGLSLRRDAALGRGLIVPEPYPNRRIAVNLQDVRTTLRIMRRRPLFAAGVIAMLGLGMGATTAIFSVVDGVLLRPLPFPDADRLVQVWQAVPSRNVSRASMSEANFWDVRDMSRSFEEFGTWHGASFTLTDGAAAPERVNGALVSVGFFRALGARPVIGRLFDDTDAHGRDPNRVVLAHRYWLKRFGGDRSVVGRSISLGGTPRLIVGVLPPGTPWLDGADLFVPLARWVNANRGSWEYSAVGRLKPGVTIDAARADLGGVMAELARRYPKDNDGAAIAIESSSTWGATEALQKTLWMLLGATGLLMLIACVNVTNLLLAQASARARDRAVRTALGATRLDLVRERLIEALVYSGAGATAGWVVATVLLSIFKQLDPGGIPRLPDVALDWRAAAFTGVAALFVALATGVVPAMRAHISDIVSGLRPAQRGAVGDRQNDRVRQTLVAAEVALSLVLLVGAGLLVRSLTQVLSADRGFQTEERLLATVSIPASYAEPRRAEIVETILARVGALPQVKAVAAVSGRPLAGGSTGLGMAAADHPDASGAATPWATWRLVTKDYFRTIGLALVAGRGFTEHDLLEPKRVVISKRLADTLWPGENPIGRTAILWKGQNNTPGEVIGVVSDMRERGLENDPTYAVYFPAYGVLGTTTLQLVMHTDGRPEAVVPVLNDLVRAVDPTLPVSGVRTLEDIVSTSVATRRFTMMLLVAFSVVAVVLAAAGVYGVLAYALARRTAEFGVRLALGASPGHVLGRAFSHGMYPVLSGMVVGLILAFWLSQLMQTLLFRTTPHDPPTYAVVTALLLVIAALATYAPATRVLRLDPAVALREE